MNKHTILVVEDEALIAATLVRTLSSLGYDVPEPVATGEDAIRAVKARQPDLVLMDIQLIGEMNGIEAAEKIRAIADIPVVYLTAYTDDLRLKQAKLTDPYGYLVKPAHSRELHATIEMALYKHALDKKLKESEERLRLTLDAINDGIWDWDIPTGTAFFSPRWYTMLGYAPDEMFGSYATWRALIHPDDIRAAEQSIQDHLLNGEEGYQFEFRMRTKDGDWKWILARGRVVERDADCKPVRMLGTHTDISGRKQAEEELRESESRFHEFFEREPHYCYIIAPDGKILDLNTSALNALGYSNKEELIGKPLLTTIYAPVSHERVKVLFGKWKDTGRIDNEEVTIVTRTGEERTVLLDVSAVYGRDGAILHSVSIQVDITDNKRMVEALQKSEEKYRLIAENTADTIWIFAMDLHLTYMSPSVKKMRGFTVEEAMGQTLDQMMTPESVTMVIKRFEEEMALEALGTADPDRTVFFETDEYCKDGSIILVENYTRLLREADGRPFAILGISRDITERKRAEEALHQANKKLTLLSSITRHDITNQLSVLMGYLTILKKKQTDPTVNDYFVKVSTAAQRISSMIKFTKEYENIGVNAPVWQDARTLVDTAAKEAPLGQVVVKNDLPAGAGVFADPLIIKVFYNLMDNAIRYGGKITTIRFSVEQRDGDHVVVCEDDGEGVPVGEKDKIFERGFGKNTGLGLALSREILSITGITIRENGETGKGARFEMTVPKGAWSSTGKGG